MPTQILPYGSWPSPVTTDVLTSDSVSLGSPRVDSGDIYWIQARASDGGRTEIIRRTPDGVSRSVTPRPWNVRSRVHEYGGGAYAVRDGVVVFAHVDDLRLYRLDVGEPDHAPIPISPAGVHRYGEPVIDVRRRRVIAVREDHSDAAAPVNTLVSLDLDGANEDGGRVIVSGSDFVASVDLSADGDHLAWVSWDLPHMAWERSTVWRAELDADGLPTTAAAVTDGTTWVQQPRWAPDGHLFYIDETADWAHLVVVDSVHPQSSPRDIPAPGLEFGGPNWQLGQRDYDFLPDGRVLAIAIAGGISRLVVVDATQESCVVLEAAAVRFDGVVVTPDGNAVTVTGTTTAPTAVSLITLPDQLDQESVEVQTLQSSTGVVLDPAGMSVAESVNWHNGNGEVVHGFFYPAHHAEIEGPPGEKPPLLVVSHGGPTGQDFAALDLELQYWTSRGFAILDVNYGGSTGFGRPYRERLAGGWGLVDLDDCVTGAAAMADQGRADRARLAIRGGSAGGYTTLRALTESDVFAAGASHYGVGDLESLARETHKFESRYLDWLIGPYPERRDLYLERSPIQHLDKLSSPMILLQGADDQVVPPDQAESMAAALRAKGLPVALLVFQGEGHGFRDAANIKRALEAELSFYGRVLGFEIADVVDPLQIDNLPDRVVGVQ